MTLAHRGSSPRWELLALLALALLAMGGSVRNGWIQDDPPLIEYNPRVHEITGLWSGFTEAYWPPPSPGGLYRPLARTVATLQWLAGDGSVLVFRGVGLALYLALVLAVYAVARQLLPPSPAWAAAALFAVHPVHVEAVAVAVDQGELVVALAACAVTLLWLRLGRGAEDPRMATALTAGTILVALGFKEHAMVLPFLPLALECTVLRGGPAEGRRARWTGIAALIVVALAWWGIRALVLGGIAGAAPAEGLRGEPIGARALTMLGVAGEWVRLLVWPARLQGDYAPWEIAPYVWWSAEQTAGLLALLAFGLALALAWRRRPALAFALLWVALALAPVSNIVIPTGILLAERTLVLASVGVVLPLAWLLDAGGRRLAIPPRLLTGLLAALLLAGAIRSATRMTVFRDRTTYLEALRRDAPASWRTMVGAGIAVTEGGDPEGGERLFREAHALWPAAPRPIQMIAFYARLGGDCAKAVPLLEQSLWLQPDDRWTRLPLVACLLDLGRYDDARRTAVADTAPDLNGRALRAAAATADSARRVHAPPHTVRLAPIRGGLVLIGTPPPRTQRP